MMKSSTKPRLDLAAKSIAKFHLNGVLAHGVAVHNKNQSTFEEWKTTLRFRPNQKLFSNQGLTGDVSLVNVSKTPYQLNYLANEIDHIVKTKIRQMTKIAISK